MSGTELVGRARTIVAVVGAIAVATLLVALVELALRIEDGSALYLVAVVAVALRFGAWPAVLTALGGLLTYNFLFIEPRFSLVVGQPDELLTLVLLMFTGVVIGRLAGTQRDREREALRREAETAALFTISRELAASEHLADALRSVSERLAAVAHLDRVWIGVGPTIALERTVADTGSSVQAPSAGGTHSVLQRTGAGAPASWVTIRPAANPRRAAAAGTGHLYRVEVRAGDEAAGSLWGLRLSGTKLDPDETRLIAAAADQVGAAIRRDRLMGQAAELEIARRSDELKSALVDSVSHDLRTPLATIRAAAGSLADAELELADDERRTIAASIDGEAERLSHLVGDLLDMSRIQGGALIPQLEVLPLDEVLAPVIERAVEVAPGRIGVEVPDELPPVRADGALLDRVISNVLDNAMTHTPPDAPIRVRAAAGRDSTVVLTIEDGGPGVPESTLHSIFERFARGTAGGRQGVGLGLTVARGLAEAMGADVAARRSELGGLAVSITLPADSTKPEAG